MTKAQERAIRKRSPLRESSEASGLSIWQEALFGIELLLLHAAPVYYGLGAPHGNGAGVILIPGFLFNDIYMMEMYAWLKRIGYSPYYSGIGMNVDCPNLLIGRRLNETINRARQETGGKIHLVGHSLGGIIARSAAAARPQDVASVTTLGSPFRGTAMHPRVVDLVSLVRSKILRSRAGHVLPECYTSRCTCSFLDCLRKEMPAGIAETAVFSKTDGLVDWRYCITDDPSKDFEVTGTHLGLAFNPSIYRIIAHRLAVPGSRP